MALDVLVDSDIVAKLCLYSLRVWEDGQLFAGRSIATLAASRYILPKRLKRSKIAGRRDHLMGTLASFTQRASFIEPEEQELALAAALELSAQRRGFAFDTGESQLLAILVCRPARILLTGDKRAIIALAMLQADHTEVATCSGRVGCLEQLFIQLLKTIGGAALRSSVCAEPHADRTLSISFRCASEKADDGTYLEGLVSYLKHLRQHSGAILHPDDGLSCSAEEDGVGLD